MRILIAEDDGAMLKILRLYFERDGFEVLTASDGRSALDLLCSVPCDLAVLDWMMPGMSGEKVCREVRRLGLPVRLILLTARSAAQDELEGLQNGADDYLRKPFEPRVLLLRARKLLRAEELLRCGPVQLNPATGQAELAGARLELSRREYDLLECFLRNQSVVLTRDTLLARVWGPDFEGDDRTLDTHIRRLRAKIGDGLITTRRGLGYCMERQG